MVKSQHYSLFPMIFILFSYSFFFQSPTSYIHSTHIAHKLTRETMHMAILAAHITLNIQTSGKLALRGHVNTDAQTNFLEPSPIGIGFKV